MYPQMAEDMSAAVPVEQRAQSRRDALDYLRYTREAFIRLDALSKSSTKVQEARKQCYLDWLDACAEFRGSQ